MSGTPRGFTVQVRCYFFQYGVLFLEDFIQGSSLSISQRQGAGVTGLHGLVTGTFVGDYQDYLGTHAYVSATERQG